MYQVLLLYSILILHILGNVLGWYYTIPHFDTLMHFLGGFWVAMFLVYLIKKYAKDLFRQNKLKEILFLIGITMIIGFFWELYEFLADTFIFNKALFMQQSVVDTITDLIADFFGVLAYFLSRRIFKDLNI